MSTPTPAEIELFIVWLPMLAGDTAGVAAQAAGSAGWGQRAHHFWDPGRLAGAAIARGLARELGTIAWDIYLFYRPGCTWDDEPPEPAGWVHQLERSVWADPTRYRTGPALIAALREMLDQVAGRGR